MIKVLIVDDERLVRIGVRSSLQWEDHGFEVVGEAGNGEEALQKIHDLHPDLVLTDIRMPKMDGIQLLKEIERQKLPVESVIMSCYDDFELVRSAMRHGASDYILKLSASDDEMLETLARCSQRILSRQQEQDKKPRLEAVDYHENFIQLVLNPSDKASEAEALLQYFPSPLDVHNMAMFIFAIDPVFDSSHMSYSLPDKKAVILLCNLLRDDLLQQKQGDIFLLDKTAGLFLLCLKPNLSLNTLATDIMKKAKSFFNLTLSMCIMDYQFCSVHLFSFVRQAIDLLTEKKFSLGRGCIFTITNDILAVSPESSIPITDFLKEIKGLADLGNLTGDIRHLCEMMQEKQSSRNASLVIFSEIFYKIAGLLRTYRGSIDGLNQKCGINLFTSLQSLTYLEDAPEWFRMYFSNISDYLNDCAENWTRNEILTAIRYINENYNLPISAQKVARLVGISEAYFSLLFKKETGSGFSEYLTNLRMEKAKALLEDKNIFIYEICEYVGYSDANYFGKVFKKHTGLSPEAYRKSRLSQMPQK